MKKQAETIPTPDYYYDQLMHYYKVLKMSFKDAIKKAQQDVAEIMKKEQ